ncbi:MAG: protocatechuate 3,4-dioxygenase subunit alpha [Geminicoccaceae bacterium]
MAQRQTPSQTVGPYFAYGLTAPQYGYPFTAIAGGVIATEGAEGERMRIVGQVLDGERAPVNDALIEIWQANANGRYHHPADRRTDNYDPAFKGFGRVGTGTDPHNRFIFHTVKPGAIGDGQAPHLNVTVLMRGMLTHAFTRIYFSDEETANAADPVLSSVPKERRGTLIAEREDTAGAVYRFDIHMQGDAETVFFDV